MKNSKQTTSRRKQIKKRNVIMNLVFLIIIPVMLIISISITIIVSINAHKSSKTISGLKAEVLELSGQVAELEAQLTEAETEPEPEPVPVPADDVQLLGDIIFAEAAGCDDAERIRVGQVVLNRVHTSYWEFATQDTILDVVSSGDYPTTWGRIQAGLRNEPGFCEEAYARCHEIAEGLLAGTMSSCLSDDVFWQTRTEPKFNATVVFRSTWHCYSVPNE